MLFYYIIVWRREPESNRPTRICNPVHNRFAIAPQGELLPRKIKGKRERFPGKFWSGKRDSNSRPIPWQGIALPTELFPQKTKSALYGYCQLCQEREVAIDSETSLSTSQLASGIKNHRFRHEQALLCIIRDSTDARWTTFLPYPARMVKLVDTTDLKSVEA
jgi:hypothetical protein